MSLQRIDQSLIAGWENQLSQTGPSLNDELIFKVNISGPLKNGIITHFNRSWWGNGTRHRNKKQTHVYVAPGISGLHQLTAIVNSPVQTKFLVLYSYNTVPSELYSGESFFFACFKFTIFVTNLLHTQVWLFTGVSSTLAYPILVG